jgi:predicted Ser/Thr protein kinase/cell division protein FtsN
MTDFIDSPMTATPCGDTTIVTAGGGFEAALANGGRSTGGLKASLEALQARLAVPARYEVLAELGRGGMGIVYKVRDIETCEVVALKILKPEIAEDPAMRENLRKEVCLARKVTHKNVCRIHEFSRSETTACISMEYVDGESLLSKMHRRGALSAADTVEIGRQICAGLREAHAQGIIHRDLKPANIIIAADKTVKIMDFGVARRSRETSYETGTLAGTPAYMAPEQLEMGAIGAYTDVYSLGLMLYEMVTGVPAFAGETAIAIALKQLQEAPPPPSDVVPTIPARLETAILKCIEKDPERRFASVDELGAALEKSVAPAGPPSKRLDLQPATKALTKVGKAALADLDLLGKKIQGGARETHRFLRPLAEKWIASLRQRDWRAEPSRKAQAAAFALTLFATAAVFGLTIRQRTRADVHAAAKHVASPASVAAAPAAAPASSQTQVAVSEPTSPFDAKEFEFDATPASDATAQADASGATVLAVAAKPLLAVSATPVAVPKRPKAQRTRATLAAKASAAPATPVATAPPDNLLAEELPLDGRPDISARLAAFEPAPAPAARPESDAKPDSSETYLEVGSFNDAGWADQAVAQLSQLGLKAVSVHKTHLWMQSYHVEVGPFQNLADLEAAETKLSDKGFKSHAVK